MKRLFWVDPSNAPGTMSHIAVAYVPPEEGETRGMAKTLCMDMMRCLPERIDPYEGRTICSKCTRALLNRSKQGDSNSVYDTGELLHWMFSAKVVTPSE